VESSLSPLLDLFERERAAGRPLVLGVVLETAGSTYRKPGALMLFAESGEYAGLLSGGCLEGDLREHSEGVRRTGVPRIVSYDLRGPDDLLWGLGVGCEGAMSIGLLRVDAMNEWQPLAHLARALAAHQPTGVGLVIESADSALRAGTILLPQSASGEAGLGVAAQGNASSSALEVDALHRALGEAIEAQRVGWLDLPGVNARVFSLPLALPPRILLLGAGPDTLPVVDFAARLGWKVTLVDHRPAYAQPARFPQAERVIQCRPDDLARTVDLSQFRAVVVMSHHLPSDLSYLRALADSTIPYVGLLGPAIRREKLLSDLGEAANALRPRLRAPVGLALGGRAPESIALAIIAEIHAFVHDARGRPFSEPDDREQR
jgi:xanthine dehydrogenase accessory factor